MGQTCLVQFAMALLRAVTVGGPDLRLMPGHGLTHDLGGTGECGGVNHGVLAMKHPMKTVDALDPHAGLVAGDKLRLTQDRQRGRALVLERRLRAREHIHQRALADGEAKKIEERLAQPLI